MMRNNCEKLKGVGFENPRRQLSEACPLPPGYLLACV
uniref:Uncharacterized protein n=1 Tax=Arundo donax TaxID=35708 RepID=A0A0A9C892_ARUDO